MMSRNRIYASSKLSDLLVLQKCTYVQPSINYFPQKTAGAVLFTGLPPFNLKSASQYSIFHGRQAINMPDVCKTDQFCLSYVSVKQFSFGAWCHRMSPLVWLNSACNCWTVSCISLQSAGSLLLCQEYIQTARKCQRYSPKWLSTQSVIWQIITDFLKLLSDFDF